MSESDLQKLLDTLLRNKKFLMRRDEMNAEVHLAQECRYSPLTVETMAACDRARQLVEDAERDRMAFLDLVRAQEAQRASENKDIVG